MICSELCGTAIICGVAAFCRQAALAHESVLLAPVPAADAPLAATHGSETAILSGGCFWGLQDVFQHVKGGRQAIAGYTGGTADPTELDDQGPDSGTQYRTEMWVETPQQRHIAEAYVSQLTAAHVFATPIVTRVDTAMPFYRAEDYHQNYATLPPDSLYIATYDAPKVAALAKLFPGLYEPRPVLARLGNGT